MEKSQVSQKNLESYFHSDAFAVSLILQEDISAVISLINHAFAYQDKAKGAKRIDEPGLQKKMDTTEFYVWKDASREVVATVYIVFEADTAHFGLLAVSDELRGTGLAASIMTTIEDYAHANAKSILELDYMSLSPWLGKYYERFGFAKLALSKTLATVSSYRCGKVYPKYLHRYVWYTIDVCKKFSLRIHSLFTTSTSSN